MGNAGVGHVRALAHFSHKRETCARDTREEEEKNEKHSAIFYAVS